MHIQNFRVYPGSNSRVRRLCGWDPGPRFGAGCREGLAGAEAVGARNERYRRGEASEGKAMGRRPCGWGRGALAVGGGKAT